ncbi:mannose/fructose/sorbose family PTS [Streptococcus oralis subsp. tigurinus]|uniref:Mannose/fructose/sorbose family PTS n=1 Tax=Streptococcus oralis subsp. tigurinus TaxID=1077464 RepID=A0A1X1FVB4_STROR|nr:mannose/fructose/sorbose family PTS [Streptococcus oralis subsp. tigurinus]
MKEYTVSFLSKLQGNSREHFVFLIKNGRICLAPHLLIGYPRDKLVKPSNSIKSRLFSVKK